MLLSGPTVQLTPFHPTEWHHFARWFYDEKYAGMFRHHLRALNRADFERFPQLLNAEVMLINHRKDNRVIGYVQSIVDPKPNRAFHLGLLIDTEYQKQQIPGEVLHIYFDYMFNRLGFRKAVIEILESNQSLKKLLDMQGFQSEGQLIADSFQNGEFVNELRYCMFADAFNKRFKETVQSWQEA